MAGTSLHLPQSSFAGRDADRERVLAIVKNAGSSFFWGMRVLPPQKRAACFAVYAFCREVDDIADGDAPAEEKRAALVLWREEIARLYAGMPTRPVTRVLKDHVARYGLDRDAFLAIIEGMDMDAQGPICAPSWRELELYCARVAGAVGLLCVRIFGVEGMSGNKLSHALGRALQLTNILRDLAEDAALGRLYLPQETLSAAGIEVRAPFAVLADPHLPAACRYVGLEARKSYDEASAIMAGLNADMIRPARIMMEIYKRPLARMEAGNFTNLQAPRRGVTRLLGKAEKFAVALRYALF